MSNNPCYVLVTPRHNPTNYTNPTNLTHCQTTSRQLDASRPTQQPAYLSSRSTQLTSLTATQHLDSSMRLDQLNNRLIYEVDHPKCVAKSDVLQTVKHRMYRGTLLLLPYTYLSPKHAMISVTFPRSVTMVT